MFKQLNAEEIILKMHKNKSVQLATGNEVKKALAHYLLKILSKYVNSNSFIIVYQYLIYLIA